MRAQPSFRSSPSALVATAATALPSLAALGQSPPPGDPAWQCCLPSGACVNVTEADCTAAGGVPSPGLVCPVAIQTLDWSGATSWDGAADDDNVVLIWDLAGSAGLPSGTAVHVLSVGWDLSIETLFPSWLSDAALGFNGTGGPFNPFELVVIPGLGDDVAGSGTYDGSADFDAIAETGYLTIQAFEIVDDHPDAVDATYLAGSTLSVAYAVGCLPAVHNVTRDTWHETIQSAITGAVDGDVIEASARTYHETVDFMGKAITVRSAPGVPPDTVIDGDGVAPVVRMGGSVGATLRGFVVTGGTSTSTGGGVLVEGGSATIDDCWIAYNQAFAGGGVAVTSGATVAITDAVLSHDAAPTGFGGGLYVTGGGSVTVSNSIFELDSAAFGGAAFVTDGSDVTFYRVTMDLDGAEVEGSAVYADGAPVQMHSCVVRFGTGLGLSGAAVVNHGSFTMVIANGTFVDNLGVSAGAVGGENIEIHNSIFRDNEPKPIAGHPSITVNRSNVQGGWSGPGGGNIDADPLFVNQAAGDLALLPGSPCVNRGDDDAPAVCLEGCTPVFLPTPCLDRAGDNRLQQCRVDMGAYESPWFNDCNANGISDACDVSPVFGYICTAFPDLVHHLPGDSSTSALVTAVSITGNNDGSPGPSVAWAEYALSVTGGSFEFDLGYDSDDGACAESGSWDYPVFHLDGTFYGINHDGTLAGPSDGSCTGGGTIGNDSPAFGVHVTVDLAALAGPGPYTVGIGVNSVDNQFHPGVVTFWGFRAVDDANGNGVPDACDCPGDTNGDGAIDIDDLVNVVLDFGTDGSAHGGDVDDGSNTGTPDGTVNIDDIVYVVLRFGGPCA